MVLFPGQTSGHNFSTGSAALARRLYKAEAGINAMHMFSLKGIHPKTALFLLVGLLLWAIPCTRGAEEYSRENAVVRAVRLASPVVVNISSEIGVRKRVNPFARRGRDSFFDSIFRDLFDPRYEQQYKRTSLGSGVIIDGNRGFILTNAHVIAKSGTITVVLRDEREFEAHIVGADPDSDLAVLRISSQEPLPAIAMGNSDDLMIGETVIAIGNPFGFSNTVTSGVISALNRSIRTEDRVLQDFIQTDASINPGNSGGPLLNVTGELIGINSAIYEDAQGIGFAIPINKAKRIVSDLIRYGEVIQAWIGMSVQDIDVGLAQYLQATKIKGVLITDVVSIGPAKQEGIREGDILLSVGSRTIETAEEYRLAMKAYAEGDTLPLQLWRNGEELKVSLKATRFPPELAPALAFRLYGIRVAALPEGTALRLGGRPAGGVAISELHPNAYLAQIGARPGDIIRQIDEISTSSPAEFDKAVVKYRHKRSVVILLQRGNHAYHITIRLS